MHRHSYLPVRAPGGDRGADWRDSAACVDYDPELWFAITEHQQQRALAICGSCPVAAECDQWASRNGIAFGIWGGRTEAERCRPAPPRAGAEAICEQCRGTYVRGRKEQRYCSHDCHFRSMEEAHYPCGTPTAARRHRKRGERLDDVCRKAETRRRVERRLERRQTQGASA